MSDVRKAETEKCVVDTAAWTRASWQALLTATIWPIVIVKDAIREA
jgi:hypothetical protein